MAYSIKALSLIQLTKCVFLELKQYPYLSTAPYQWPLGIAYSYRHNPEKYLRPCQSSRLRGRTPCGQIPVSVHLHFFCVLTPEFDQLYLSNHQPELLFERSAPSLGNLQMPPHPCSLIPEELLMSNIMGKRYTHRQQKTTASPLHANSIPA